MTRLCLCLLNVLAISPVVAFVPSGDYTFDRFVEDFARDYAVGSDEYMKRKTIFTEQLNKILAHNADPLTTWSRGVNKFADLTTAEFALSGRLGYNKLLARAYAASGAALTAAPVDQPRWLRPKSVDWRKKGVVSTVKDQGHCGSCWAFATTETVESHAALATGLLPTLSPQQLVECAPNPLSCGGVGGCEGSIPEVAYNYIQLYGMTTEWMMPYTSYFGGKSTCAFNSSSTATAKSVVTISGYRKLPPNDYAAVMDALAHVGPLAINVQANTWSDYHGGVFDGCSNHSNIDIDHVVQLVGYGTDPKAGDYWLVRNSWDVTWGEAGYIRLKRSSSPSCGVDPTPLDGTGCSGGPAAQKVCGTCGMLFDVSYPLGAGIPKRGHHTVVV